MKRDWQRGGRETGLGDTDFVAESLRAAAPGARERRRGAARQRHYGPTAVRAVARQSRNVVRQSALFARAGPIQNFSGFKIQDSFQNFRVQSKFLIGFFKRIDSKIQSRFKNFED